MSKSFFAILNATLAMIMVVGCSKDFASKFKGSTEGVFRIQSDKGEPVAKVGNVVLTVEGMSELIDRQMPFWKTRLAGDPQKQKEFVESQVRQKLLAQEAIKRGMLNDEEVQAQIERILVQKMTREYFDPKNQPTLSQEQMKAYYDEHQDEFNKPAKMRLSFIYVPFKENKAMSHDRIKQVHKKMMDPKMKANKMNFAKMVKEYPEKPAGIETQSDNDMPYMTQEEMNQKFGQQIANSVFMMGEDTEVSPVLEGQDGFFVFRKNGYRKATSQSFEDSKAMIERRLSHQMRRDAFDKFVAQLKTDFGVTVYEDRLSKIISTKPKEGAPTGQPAEKKDESVH